MLTFQAGFLGFCALLLIASGNLRAELAPVPVLKSRVTDLTQTLTAGEQSQLETKLAAFEQQKGSQIAVLIVATTQPEVIEQYSIRVTDAWKLGREKQDDGVLVLVAKDDRKMRIEVGRGLEGAIPDLLAKRIISEVMKPSFRQGDFYGGISRAVDKLMGLISGEQLPEPSQSTNKAGDFFNMLPLILFGGVLLGGFLRAIFGDFFGGVLNGGTIALLAWILGVGLIGAILFGVVAFVFTLLPLASVSQMGGYGGGYSRGGHSGGWSGGGGSFGGGGASGDW
jgi:uncharacterized protein